MDSKTVFVADRAAQRHILSLIDSLGELNNLETIRFLSQVCAHNQNPDVILAKLNQWGADKCKDHVSASNIFVIVLRGSS